MPTKKVPRQHRTPTPILSPQHLALARSLPHSRTSTPSPSFLTPPVSGTPAMSPPPRHEADDYMNVHNSHNQHYKRKQRGENPSKVHDTREGSEETRPQRSLRSGPQTANSDASDSGLPAAILSDGDENARSNAPLVKSLSPSNHRNHIHGPQTSTETGGVHVQASPTLTPSVGALDEHDSPAVSALRSLSFQAPVRSKSQGLQRVSTALANTFNLFRPGSAVTFADVPSRQASRKAEEASRRSSAHSKSLAYPDINRRLPTVKDGKDVPQMLETPATITLRKASNVDVASPLNTSMGASLSCEQECERAADAPASELLAFYSSPASEKGPTPSDISSPESAQAPRSPRQQSAITFEVEDQSFRERSKSISQCNDISNARRCSTPAEATLTFSDVHIAPGTFANGPKSSKQSSLPAESNRRISIVQFRSRNSVHEVIWREDDTTSGSSLTASSRGSQYAEHSFRSTPSSESRGSPTREPAIKSKETKALLPAVPESVPVFTKMPDRLFQWTWGQSSASIEHTPQAVDIKSDTVGPVAETTARSVDTKRDPLAQELVNSTLDPDLVSLQQSSDQQDSRFQKPSISKLPRLQSFPTLRSRSSTAEWQKAPLVDLNDPFAGRASRCQVEKVPHFAELGTGVGDSKKGRGEIRPSLLYDATTGRRSLSSSYATAGLCSVSSVGSSIGASSRKRVMSRRNRSTKFSC